MARMKMSKEKFERLAEHVEEIARANGGWERVLRIYREGEYPRAERTRDVWKRLRWDIFWLVPKEDRREIAHGLDDSHIDTALRRLVPNPNA